MGDRGTEALRGIDLEMRSGEIVGLAGVSGNGQRELAQCLAGLRKVTAGQHQLIGETDITQTSLKQRIDAGQAYIPEERMRDGAIRDFSVQENVFLHDHAAPAYTHGIFLNFAKHGTSMPTSWCSSSASRRPAWIRRSRTCPAATFKS